MKAIVYPLEREVEVTEENIEMGVIHIECPECSGTGVFWITDEHSQPCNRCKTRGLISASL